MSTTTGLCTLRRLLAPGFILGALLLPLLLTAPARAQGIDNGLVGYWPFDEGHGLSSNIADGAYHHVVGSYDGINIRFYYDGAHYNTLETTGGALLTGQGVSFSVPDAPLDGALDDVRLYNRALTDNEVAGLVYNCANVQGIPVSECRALVALATNTGQWSTATNWFANHTPCTWFGVLCKNGLYRLARLILALTGRGLAAC